MSENFQQQYGEQQQGRNSQYSQMPETPFHAYQNPGYPSYLQQQQMERTAYPVNPYQTIGPAESPYNAPQPTNIIGRNGLPVQGTGRGDTLLVTPVQQLYPSNQFRPQYGGYGVSQEMPPAAPMDVNGLPAINPMRLPNGTVVTPEILAQEQKGGHISNDMIQAANQVWKMHHNPAEVSQLLNAVNNDFIAMRLPIYISCGANYPNRFNPQEVNMSMTFTDVRRPQEASKIILQN